MWPIKFCLLFSFLFALAAHAELTIDYVPTKSIAVADLFYSTGIEYSQDNLEHFYKANPYLENMPMIPAQVKVSLPFAFGQKMFWNYDLISSFKGHARLELRRIFKQRGQLYRTSIQKSVLTAKNKQNAVVKKRFKQRDLFLGASLRYALVTLTDTTTGAKSEVSSRMNWSLKANYVLYSDGRFLIKGLGGFTKYSFFPAQYQDGQDLSFQTYSFGGCLEYYLSNSIKLYGSLQYGSFYAVESATSNQLHFFTYSSLAPRLGASYRVEGDAHFLELSTSYQYMGSHEATYGLVDASHLFAFELDYRANVKSSWQPNFKLGLEFSNRDSDQFLQSISEIHFGLYFLTTL